MLSSSTKNAPRVSLDLSAASEVVALLDRIGECEAKDQADPAIDTPQHASAAAKLTDSRKTERYAKEQKRSGGIGVRSGSI